MKRISKNYIYNLIFQIVSIITPFITIPYISRVLGSYGVGVAAFTNSIVQYFILFGTLGVALYGNRSIAYVRDDLQRLRRTFWEIFFFKVVTTAIAYFTYLAAVFTLFTRHRVVYLLQSFNLIAAMLDITWFFFGMEEFAPVVIRNITVKAISISLIFLLVKSPDDVWKYVAISALGNLGSQIVMWKRAIKYVGKPELHLRDSMKHFLLAFRLFIPQVAIQVYVVLDKTMLGLLADESDVGVYSLSQRVVKMVLTIATSLGTVMLPRMSNIFARNDIDVLKSYLSKSFNFVSYLAFPLMMGLFGISYGFVDWFFGRDFKESYVLMMIMSPIIVAIGWSNVFGVQVMLPMRKEKHFTLSVTIGAITNFILNLILIPRLGSVGAAIGTLTAEVSVTLSQAWFLRNFLYKELFREVWKYAVGSLVMLCSILPIYRILKGPLLTTSQVAIGMIVYFLAMQLLKPRIHTIVVDIIARKFFRRKMR